MNWSPPESALPLSPIGGAGSTGRCNTIWYKADFKGGVYDPRETVWTFCRAEERHVVPLEGGTVVAPDRARLWQGAFVHSLSGVAPRRVYSAGQQAPPPLPHARRARGDS